MKVITNRNPQFLKAVYPIPEIILVNSIDEINIGEYFIDWGSCYRVWILNKKRKRLLQAKFDSINAALFYLKGL